MKLLLFCDNNERRGVDNNERRGVDRLSVERDTREISTSSSYVLPYEKK
jgi:hypothetical protein